jgi:hypothetical protein
LVPWSVKVSRTIAAQVQQAFYGFLQEARRHPAEELAGWHAGLKLPVSTLCAILAGEAYIHGWDIARALRRPWQLDPQDMRTIFLGLLPVLPHYVDQRRAAGRTRPSTSACAATLPPAPSSRSTAAGSPCGRDQAALDGLFG